MKVQFSSLGRAAALLKVAASFTSRITDALAYLRLEALADSFTVTANGDEGQFLLTIPGVTIIEMGTIIVRADLVSGLFGKNAHADAGTLSVKDATSAEMKVGRNRYTLRRLLAVDNLIEVPSESPIGGAEMASEQMVDAFDFVTHAMARSDVRYYLNGCCVTVGTKTVEFAATDGHRLARTIERIEESVRLSSGSVIVPQAAVPKIVAALAATGDKRVRLVPVGTGFCVCTESFALHGKSIDGRYPDVNAVIPKEAGSSAVISAKALMVTLDRTGLISAGQKFPHVDCRSSGGGLVFTYEGDAGEIEEHIDADFDGPPGAFDFRLDPHYLRDAAAAVGAGQIRLTVMPDPNRPIRWTGSDAAADQRGGVIMPMRR